MKRRQVAQELLATEETYVKNLQDLMNVFCTPMEINASGPEENRQITKDDVRAIFGSLKIILPINKLLLEDLRQKLQVSDSETILIGDSFKNMVFFNPIINQKTYIKLKRDFNIVPLHRHFVYEVIFLTVQITMFLEK